MDKNILQTPLYREALSLYESFRQPGTGQISDIADLSVSPDGRFVAFSGTIVESLRGTPPTRICQVDLRSADLRVLTFGPNTDRLPKYSPDERYIAFLSDRAKSGDFQLHLFDRASGTARPIRCEEGWVEYLHWSPDGTRLLLGVAGHGADLAGGQGAVTSQTQPTEAETWMPEVQTGKEGSRWRRAWIYEPAADRLYDATPAGLNAWEGVWCGSSSLAVVASAGPEEGLWYTAGLYIIDLVANNTRAIYRPRYQLGWPAADPSGNRVVVVEALCSDRWIVAGELKLIDLPSGKSRTIDTHGMDITCTDWRSKDVLLVAGHRRFETVVARYDASSNDLRELWSSAEVTTGGRYATISGLGATGDCVLATEDFVNPPRIAVIREGVLHPIKTLNQGTDDIQHALRSADTLTWQAPDGLEIDGWLLRSKVDHLSPLVMAIHGGPVWHWRQTWLGRSGVPWVMLLKRGYSIFLPNPRGSAGRGQAFAQGVVGDLGGADAQDCLSGLDHLIALGLADPARLGVMGLSYGGFMTSWLITRSSRFAAAIPVAPITNHVTEELISNIPHFVSLFLGGSYNTPGAKHHDRSPIMHAHAAITPTLNICGALDRCTPPAEAQQFHAALLAAGTKSVLVTYPEEGHGIRHWPAATDYAARVVSWFLEHMPPG